MRLRASVRLIDGVLDPQGDAVRRALDDLGIDGVRSVRQGKLFDIEIDAPTVEIARERAEDMCRRLLANPVTETFEIDVSEADMGSAS